MSFLTKMSYFIYDVNNIFGTVLQYALKHKDFEDAMMLNGLSRVTHVQITPDYFIRRESEGYP